MSARVTLAILLLLALCSFFFTTVDIHDDQPVLTRQSMQSTQRNNDFYCPWFYMVQGHGPLYYGWLVNGTLMPISYPVATKLFNDCAIKILAYSLWNSIPKHQFQMNDPLMMFAHVQPPSSGTLESDTFLIINGTKWPIMGGMNQTSSTGVKSEMIAVASESFFNNYPTGMYLNQPN